MPQSIEIKARYEKGQFVPLQKVELIEGEIVDLQLVKDMSFSWKGALKSITASSVELQHKIKQSW